MRVAAIDIGTVTSRLLVADVDASGTRQVARQSAITNLGEGVDASGELLPEAIDRTVAQVAEYRKVIDACAADCAVDRVVALATSASRDARNSGIFVSRLREVGVELSVIPGERGWRCRFWVRRMIFAMRICCLPISVAVRLRWYLVERMARRATLCLMLRFEHRILLTSAAVA